MWVCERTYATRLAVGVGSGGWARHAPLPQAAPASVFCSTVTSSVRRDRRSPLLAASKKAWSRAISVPMSHPRSRCPNRSPSNELHHDTIALPVADSTRQALSLSLTAVKEVGGAPAVAGARPANGLMAAAAPSPASPPLARTRSKTCSEHRHADQNMITGGHQTCDHFSHTSPMTSGKQSVKAIVATSTTVVRSNNGQSGRSVSIASRRADAAFCEAAGVGEAAGAAVSAADALGWQRCCRLCCRCCRCCSV